jgi:hypothetical protein
MTKALELLTIMPVPAPTSPIRKQFNPKGSHIPKRMALRPIMRQAIMRILCLGNRSDNVPPAKTAAVKPNHTADPRRPVWAISIPKESRMEGRAVPRIVWKKPTMAKDRKAEMVSIIFYLKRWALINLAMSEKSSVGSIAGK